MSSRGEKRRAVVAIRVAVARATRWRSLGRSRLKRDKKFVLSMSARSFGASHVTVFQDVYSRTPRGTLLANPPLPSPRPEPKHEMPLPVRLTTGMLNHHGRNTGFYGWGEERTELQGRHAFNWQRHGERSQSAEGLGASPHPYLKPSQRLHGNTLDTGIADMLPPRASRKPSGHPKAKDSDQLCFMSWPGTGVMLPRHKHWRPRVDSRNEARGELPPSAHLLLSAGSRPGFPTCARACDSNARVAVHRLPACLSVLTPGAPVVLSGRSQSRSPLH